VARTMRALGVAAVLFLSGTSAAMANGAGVSGIGYTTQNRSIVSSGINRPFLQATPTSGANGKPLVLVLHGDGGNGAGIRAGLPLEASAAGAAVFVYPNAPGGTFEYFTSAGRTREVQFVRDVVNLLHGELAIDRTRVFLSGFSGGGTMANALACRMGAAEIRGFAVNAGSLYPIDNDFTYTGNGGVSCNLPASMLLWGESDNTAGVNYATGVAVRNNFIATHNCGGTTTAFAPSPCVLYNGCQRDVGWCSIPGMGHSIWNQSAAASWAFFQRQGAPAAADQIIYSDSLQNGWQDFSWGVVNFANASNPHSGAMAIRFDADSFEGLSFAKPGAAITAAQFPELRFFIRGTTGGESFQISLQTGATLHANVPLAGFISGGAIAAGSYREVRVRFADPPISYSGSFERINIQDATGTPAANPQIVYVDSVTLITAGSAPVLLQDGFE
jgi:polyhydroxybutyrate depolymerase